MNVVHVAPTTDDYESQLVRGELTAISEEHGVITPEMVLARGRDPASPLHSLFDWDDSQAAEKFRLLQARGLIRRVKVSVIRASTEAKVVTVAAVREFVSNQSERASRRNPEGGYASIVDVLNEPDRRADMLATARAELAALRRKYEALNELAIVWIEIDKLLS